MVVRAVALFFFISVLSFNSFAATARTWPTANFQKDPGSNLNHIFGVYKSIAAYTDPDFNEALQLSSPLNDQKFESYDVAVIITVKDGVDAITQSPIRGQTVRVYIREEAFNRLGADRFANTQYDRTTGLLFYWKTSTARNGKTTPRGYYRPESFSSDHKSSLYNDSPMPWTVFFNGSIATHGSTHIDHLGRPASAGCARLEPQRGKDLFQLVGSEGKDWVDKINTSGNFIYTTDGKIVQEINYKTLISVQ